MCVFFGGTLELLQLLQRKLSPSLMRRWIFILAFFFFLFSPPPVLLTPSFSPAGCDAPVGILSRLNQAADWPTERLPRRRSHVSSARRQRLSC